jgi:hypothetical protein
LATFDYFKAIWKTGPGVVSDAPDWVLAEIERELPLWTGAHERGFVGVHLCAQSNLVLGILVSPSASGDDGSLENARYGSFIHVFATDHPGRATLRVDEVRELFESTYGAPISDGTVRQQRNFMLLDFPYHQDLARDLFIGKDRVEGGLEFAAPVQPSESEETLAAPVQPSDSEETLAAPVPPAESEETPADPVPHQGPTSRPLPQGSLSSLLSHYDPVVPPPGEGGLPFDQGLSYAEVVAGLRERLYGKSSAVEPEHTVGGAAVPERPISSPSSSVDLPSPDQPVVAMPAVSEAEAVDAKAGVAGDEETELELPNFEVVPVPVLERDAPLSPRRTWSPIYTVAGLLVIGVLIGGAIVLRPWERAPVDASLAEHPAPVAVLPEVSARPLAPELAGLDRRQADAEVSSQVDALDIGAPELQPKAIIPPLDVATDQAEPDLPSIDPAAPPVIAEAEATAELPVLAAVKTESLPDAVARGVTGGLAPAPAIAQVEVVTEPERAIQDGTSSADVETASAFDPAFDVDAAGTLSEPSVETLEESAVARLEETPETSSAEAEAEAVVPSIVVDRETNQRDGRRKRERKRIMGQINRYR